MVRKASRWWMQLAVVVSLGLIVPAHAQPSTGAVSGTLELAGAPVAGARIVVACSADSAFEVETATDGEGSFSLDGVPLGQVSVRAFNSRDELLAEGVGELTEDGGSTVVEMIPVS